MKKNFENNPEIEYILNLIQKDSSILNEFNIDELEIMNNYLDSYKNYLMDFMEE